MAAGRAEVLVRVVKPQDREGRLAEIHDHVAPGNLVVSLAAGIPTAYLESRLPEGSSVVRVMPNTCLLYTSPSPRDRTRSRMPSSA